MAVTLRLYDGAGSFLSMLPAVSSIDVQHVLNDEGAGTLSYVASGVGAAELIGLGDNLDLNLTDCQVGVHLDGKEVFRFLLEEDEDNEADAAGKARLIRIGGPGTLALLNRGIVLPEDGIGAVPATNPFVNATAGKIMLDLLTDMKTRGYLTQVETSFTAARDSAGQVWDSWIDVEYDAGRDLLTVVKDLANTGVCDVRMVGMRLDMFNPNTALGVDRPNIYIRRAHASNAPRRRSRRNLRTDFLVVGDEGINTLRFDQDARDRYGRRIGFIGQGNTISASELYRVGDEALKENARPTAGHTIDLRLTAPSCPQPYIDFQLGDQIRSDFGQGGGGGYEPMRVRSIAVTYGEDGATGCSMELNDRFTEAILDLQRKVDGIRHGKIGSSSRPPTTPDPGQVTTLPRPPATIRTRGQLSYTPEGMATATMEVSWPPVEVRDDDSPLDNLAHYDVRYLLVDRQFGPIDGGDGDSGGDDTGGGSTEPTLVETFVENFARPTSLRIGNDWTQVGGDFNLVSESARTTSGSTVLLRDYGRKNLYVEANLTAEDGIPSVIAWADVNIGASSGYVARYNPLSLATNVQLMKDGAQVAGTHFGPSANRIGGGTHTLGLDIQGNVITVSLDGTVAITWTDPGAQPTGSWAGAGTGTKARLSIEDVRMSEWRAGTPDEPDPDTGTGDAYTIAGTTTETSMLITGLPTATRVQAEVSAVDTAGNRSEWMIAEIFLTPGDDAPPPPPAALELEAHLGGVRVRWSRTTSDGGSVPPDFDEIEVYASTVGATFQPDPLTRLGTMTGTVGFFTGLPYDQVVWFRAIMVDHVGNKSEPSQGVSIIPRKLVSAELGIGQVLASNLANGSVGVDKLTVGVLSDSMLLNANFEDLTDSGLPVSWVLQNAGEFLDSTYAVDTTLPKSGSRSIRMRSTTGRRAGVVTQPFFPTTAGEWYFASSWLRGSSGTARTRLQWYDSSRNLISTHLGLSIGLSASWQQSIALAKAPETGAFVRVEISTDTSAANTDVWVDSADLRKATGRAQILDASIGAAQIEDLAVQRAKIAFGAVGDLQVGSISVDKLTAGELRATYMTVTGRLTSKAAGSQTGARWELDSAGFRAYRADGSELLRFGSDGTAFYRGSLDVGVQLTSPIISGGRIDGGIFRSTGYLNRSSWIEMGDVRGSDAGADELHFYNGGVRSSIRNPTNQQGALRFSVSGGQVFNMSGNGFEANIVRANQVFGSVVYDSNQRVYSPNNPPPSNNHSHTNQHIAGSYLMSGGAIGPLFIGNFQDWNTSLYYKSTLGGGPAIHGFGNGIQIYATGFSGEAIANAPASTGAFHMRRMAVNGSFKSFVIDHPTDPDRHLVHAAVEGPTADVFYRGEGNCQFIPHGDRMYDRSYGGHGVAVITLPDYFEALTELEGRTVQVTPILGCSADCAYDGCQFVQSDIEMLLAPTLAVTPVINGQFIVRTSGGYDHHCAHFFWEVKAVRKNTPVPVEPLRTEYGVAGDGPYTYLTPAA